MSHWWRISVVYPFRRKASSSLHLMLMLQVVQQTAKLTNVSLERARFTVHRPQLPLQASCPTGPLAAGMETSIKITFQSKDIGDYSGELHVSSEFNTFAVTVSAKVIPRDSQLESQDSELPLDAPILPHSKQ
ncbi:Sperm-associated antigen 17 [Trebouxia sp. C0010 RCD-2024]